MENNLTLDQILESAEAVLPGKSSLVLLALAVGISHLIDKKTPLWLMFVGVPSSAKTEVVRMLSKHPEVYFLDALTENAFVSGSSAQAIDLLPMLDGKCLVVKDFTTTLSYREEMVKKLLGDLTSIYDASFSKHSPGRGTISYQSFFSILGCVTPQALNKHQRYMNQIGPRFLFYRVPNSSEAQIERGLEVMWASSDSRSALEDVQEKVSQFYQQIIEELPEINLQKESSEVMDFINKLARFIAHARGLVITKQAEFENSEGEKVTFYELLQIQIEEPYRAMAQLRVLAKSLAVVNGQTMIGKEELILVRAVALSSMPADRSLLLSVITSEKKAWSAKEVADKLGISHKTALRQMDELVSLEILSKSNKGTGLANLYQVTAIFEEILYPREEFMSNPHLTETQTPHHIDSKQPLENLSDFELEKISKDIFGEETKLEG